MAFRLTLDPIPIETPRVVFDITRLYRNRASNFGTGVDRIDLAIGRDLARRFGPNCLFIVVRHGGFAELPRSEARALMAALARRWRAGRGPAGADSAAAILRGRAAAAAGSGRATAEETYVVASHSGLPQREGYLRRFDPAGLAQRVAYIHDLIPLEYPEYQTLRSRTVFRRYLAELAGGPVKFVVNSVDTGRRLAAYAADQGWETPPPLPLIPKLDGAPPPAPEAPRDGLRRYISGETPFFLVVGTIEPRKNHLLLLNLWREMAEDGPPPHLVIAGRRGWMNENVVAMLDECAAIRPYVAEFGDLGDGEIGALMRQARALLMPSFAEGLGIPVMEAAAAGLTVISSDLPAIREIAAPGARFLSPLDGLGWRREILALV